MKIVVLSLWLTLILAFAASSVESSKTYQKFPAGIGSSCPKGYEITSVEECKKAGLDYNGGDVVTTGNWKAAPCGCFIKHGNPYFDHGDDGCSNSTTTALLCKNFIVKDHQMLLKEVDNHFSADTTTMAYPIELWDVSNVKDFGNCFASTRNADLKSNIQSFNADISNWDTSNADSMTNMFYGATSFTGDLSKWDTFKVEYMSGMFHGATSFNGDISKWDTSKVVHMEAMFNGAKSFNQDISKWDISKVEDMSLMFYDATSFTGKGISVWDTSKVSNMKMLFHGAKAFNEDVSKWDLSKVTDLSNMFQEASAFNQNLCNWGEQAIQNNLADSAAEQMFLGTNCPSIKSPDLSSSSSLPGPFCHQCSITVKPEEESQSKTVTNTAAVTTSVTTVPNKNSQPKSKPMTTTTMKMNTQSMDIHAEEKAQEAIHYTYSKSTSDSESTSTSEDESLSPSSEDEGESTSNESISNKEKTSSSTSISPLEKENDSQPFPTKEAAATTTGLSSVSEWEKEIQNGFSNNDHLAKLQYTAGFMRGVVYAMAMFVSFALCLACYMHHRTHTMYQLLAKREAELKSFRNNNVGVYKDNYDDDNDYNNNSNNNYNGSQKTKSNYSDII